jgi:tetratricopeptide (TPR) repeat protein
MRLMSIGMLVALGVVGFRLLSAKSRAAQLIMKGEFVAAVERLDRIIAGDPSDGRALSLRGIAKSQLDDLDGALADFDRAVALDSTSANAYRDRAFLRFKRRELDLALSDIDRSLALSPGRIESYATRALIRQERGEFTAALADYDSAFAKMPPRGAATAALYSNRSGTRRGAGDIDGALADAETAIRLGDRLPLPYLQRGLALALKGDSAGAERDFRRFLELNPGGARMLEKERAALR